MVGLCWAGSSGIEAEIVVRNRPQSLDKQEVTQQGSEKNILAQVTSVAELSDVQPDDWAYTALRRLVESYGCLEGYPDRTFRGNRVLSRYEFAAGLNACLDILTLSISDGNALDTVSRLQEEFATELAMVRADVEALSTEVAELEANQDQRGVG